MNVSCVEYIVPQYKGVYWVSGRKATIARSEQELPGTADKRDGDIYCLRGCRSLSHRVSFISFPIFFFSNFPVLTKISHPAR